MVHVAFENPGQAFEADLRKINLPDGVPEEPNKPAEDEHEENGE
jgi:hypothetical protein